MYWELAFRSTQVSNLARNVKGRNFETCLKDRKTFSPYSSGLNITIAFFGIPWLFHGKQRQWWSEPGRPGDLVAVVYIVGSPLSGGSSENPGPRVSWSAWAVAPLYSCREHSKAESIIRVRNNPHKASSAICWRGTVSVCFAHVEQWVAAVELQRRVAAS